MQPHYTMLDGERAYRCPACTRFLFSATPFTGLIRVKCSGCRGTTAYRDGEETVTDERTPHQKSCFICQKPLLFMAKPMRGTISRVCRTCHVLRAFRNGRAVDTQLTAKAALPEEPPMDALLQVMQERWSAQWRKKAQSSADIAVGLRFTVFQRDGFRCRYCGRTPADGALLEADHVLPRSKGGPDTLENLVTACWECNSGKSDRLLLT
jgi:5-methylcytosine-specific restriction endonuclease McrA